MMTRPPLNALQPRTLRDAARDPFDWLDRRPPTRWRSRRRRLRRTAWRIALLAALAALLA